MKAATIRRAGLWGGLLLTLYLAFNVNELLPEHADVASEPVRREPREAATIVAEAVSSGLPQRAWHEEAAGDPFRTMKWYVPPQPRVEHPTPQAPPLPFAYFGQMAEDGVPYAFLQKGNKVQVVKAGDTLDGMYRVESIAPNAVTFVYFPLNTRQTAVMGVRNTIKAEPGDGIQDVREVLKMGLAGAEEKQEKGRDEESDN